MSSLTTDAAAVASPASRALCGFLILVAVLVVAGCGSSTPSKQELAQTYLRLVKPTNRAGDAFIKKANRWDQNLATSAQAAKDAAPLIAAIEALNKRLLRVHWPPATAADVQVLVQADAAMIGDLHALRTLTVPYATWGEQFLRDGRKVSAAGRTLRVDLGLPATKP